MARIVTFLDEDMIKKLKEISEASNKSVSKITAELIEAGYNIKHNHDNDIDSCQQKKQELTDKHTEYLLRILAIIQDMYCCVRNDKSHYDTENTADALKIIKADIAEELDKFLQQK